ncbi:MAG: hypothetical protein M3320_00605 [Actinomycetota bacterium]|nr:hypothetical protein [Actinomycetota bacterium]
MSFRLENGDVVTALTVGYDDENGSTAFLVASHDAAQGAPFWVEEAKVAEHWLEPDSVATPDR